MFKYMNYSETDINILADMVKCNDLSVERVVEWAYSQYSDNGVEPWVEKITLASDKLDVLDVLRNNFHIHEELSYEIHAGKISFEYFHKKVSLEVTLSRLLY